MLNRFLTLLVFSVFILAVFPSTVVAESQEESHESASHEVHETPALNFIDFSAEDSQPLAALLFNFGALVIIVYLLMRKPLGLRFKQRKEALEKALNEAEAAKVKAEEAIAAARAKSEGIDDEIAKLRKEIVSSAEKESAAIVKRAEAQAKRLVDDTESLVAHEISLLAENLQKEIVDEIIEQATEEIQRQITDADHERLTANYVSGVKQTAEDTVKH